MAFYDIPRVDYQTLLARTKRQAPYQDSGNAYPLGDRKYSDRHFRCEEDGTFTLWYADRKVVDNAYGRPNDKESSYNEYKSSHDRRLIGRVYPDNTFEFTNPTHMGTNLLLDSALRANVTYKKNMGGTVYRRGSTMHPVFKGLRIKIDTGEAVTPYKAFLPVVNRKAANETMREYRDFINVFTSSIKVMDTKGIWEVYADMYSHEAEGDEMVWRSLDMAVVKRLIDEKKYIDAGCLFTMLESMGHLGWRVAYEMHKNPEERGAFGVIPSSWKTHAHNAIALKFRQRILKQHLDVFKFEELPVSGPLPSSQWGLRIECDGKPVERF